MRILLGMALTLNVLLLIVGWNTLFLQTHWSDPSYVGLVAVVMTTPIVNSIALIRVVRKYRTIPLGPNPDAQSDSD
jgi:hypothetical protein